MTQPRGQTVHIPQHYDRSETIHVTGRGPVAIHPGPSTHEGET